MVLESILNPSKAEDKPLHVMAIAAIFTVVAVFLSRAMFPSEASLLTIAMITIIFIPFFQKLFEEEEKKEDNAAEGKIHDSIFHRHWKSLKVFSAFFIGIVIAMSFMYIAVGDSTFELQEQTLQGFSNRATTTEGATGAESRLGATGRATSEQQFGIYFANNTQVMILVFVLSAILGAGAVFVLVWNASVIAVYAGIAGKALFGGGAAYALGVPIALGGIALHGIPEIMAYFVAGLAGGVLSVGIVKEDLGSKEFNKIFYDSLMFLILAEILVVAAAWTEAVF